jgi:ABC-type uncharacterized transport system substrate-binding protein
MESAAAGTASKQEQPRTVPSVLQTREFATAGDLVSYGAEIADAYRQLGIYAGRILKGEKPAEIQQSAKVELIINLKTANNDPADAPRPRRRGESNKLR